MSYGKCSVTPHAGAWIEMARRLLRRPRPKSLPTRERGLKSNITATGLHNTSVTPHAGAWIEILRWRRRYFEPGVTPHAGAWIEIKGFSGKG